MLTIAAKELGFEVVVVDATPNSPAAQVGAQQIVADLYDKGALRKLANRSDYMTVEIEHLDTVALESIARLGTKVHPSPKIIRLIQDKLLQKEFLRKNLVPTADFSVVENDQQALGVFQGFKRMLLKARHGAYDGRGNMLVTSISDLTAAMKHFGGVQLYAEQFVPFKKELAVMIARAHNGEIKTYPVVETIHKRNICVEALVPATITKTETQAAQKLAIKTVKLLKGVGVFGIEMFLTEEGRILVNEIAPRVHNSGHYTIEACRISQFEQHIRAISHLPLGSTSMIVPAAVMINILGERSGETRLKGLKRALEIPNSSIHIYGKSPTKIDRKMGHITVTADNIKLALKGARKARREINL